MIMENIKKSDEVQLVEDVVIMDVAEYKRLIPRFQPKKMLSGDDIVKIQKLRSQGLSLRKIARHFKVSHQTIQRVLKQKY